MEELKVSQELGVISTNLDTIASQLKEQMAEYKDYIVTEDSVTADKKVLADLRKLQKSMEDARKSVKKEWEKPYKEFESKYKNALALVEEPISLISSQIKMFEEEKAQAKLQHIKELYAEEVAGYEEYLPFEKNFNEKWLNVSTKDRDIQYDISEKKTRVMSDLAAIDGLNSEIKDELFIVYRNSDNNLAAVIKRNSDYLADKNRVQEMMKEEVIKEEKKPSGEAMGDLNNLVELFKTVHIIVSADDLQAAKNALDFSEIHYQVLEEN